MRPLAMKPAEQNIPSDPRFRQSQIPVWNYQQYAALPIGDRYGHSFVAQTQHHIPENNNSIRDSALDTARAEFQFASAQVRQVRRDEAALSDIDDGEDSLDEMDSDEVEFSDDDIDDDEQYFAASLENLQNDDSFLKRLVAPDGNELDFSGLLGGTSFSGGPVEQRPGRTRAFRRHKGPREAAKPTPDILMRLSRASDLYIAKKLDEAMVEIFEIIRINAETPQAWETFGLILVDKNLPEAAALCYLMAAHFKPKILQAWLTCINHVLGFEGSRRRHALGLAQYACAAMVRNIPNDLDARMKKAEVFVESGKFKRAISEYKAILKRDRTHKSALHKLAEVCVDAGDVKTAIHEYRDSLAQFRGPDNESEARFEWDDVIDYITLHEFAKQYSTAISELKILARWLLGREEETFWDSITDDDREWDLNDSRRLQVPAFVQGKFPLEVYGGKLICELRVKLGLCRLHLGQHDEAMAHLSILLGPYQDATRVRDYSYLFRQIAGQLYEVGRYDDAMKFYQPVRQLPEEVDAQLLVEMGRCFLRLSEDLKAAQSFKHAIEIDGGDVDARMELARMYEKSKQPEKAFSYVTEIIHVKKTQRPETKLQRLKVSENNQRSATREANVAPRKAAKERALRLARAPTSQIDKDDIVLTAEYLQSRYQLLKSEQSAMRDGVEASTVSWMAAAQALTEDFRSFKTFYPWDKYIRFLGYSGNVRVQAETSLDSDLTAMAERLSKDLGADISTKASLPTVEIPEDYRGISFRKWLDIFLDYALCLARSGQAKASYEICEAAKDAIVFCHSREDMFLIQLCWCTCALISSDEETCVSVVRFFMKDYQFTTDSYRMFAALSRACHSPVSWYNSGPTQKFILRQIKLMDFSLLPEDKRKKHYTDKGSYSAQDNNGHLIINTDMDVALLMLYGHILFTGGSYTYALNYFFRAYALDPRSPMIKLNIGLAYIHHALKRQTDNRQYSILQGLSFMLSYYESRIDSIHVEERQEAHYNMARAYHMLGLVHLATPFYQKVLKEISEISAKQPMLEELVLDTAYNLQAIYAASGNVKLAEDVTRRWLVI